ncbi:MAG: TRAP transporter small permease subunit, partial [SAR324 cluster bacterium]|nr:TRAP transporter small permease subunit [SAR324 cluster bacterium]
MDKERTDVSLETFLSTIERGIAVIAIGAAWVLLPLLAINRTFDIVARQFIATPANFVQMLEVRAFLFLVLLSFGFAYLRNAHIRVDVIRVYLTPKKQAWSEIAGFLLAVVPVCIVIGNYGIDYAMMSYGQGEREAIFLGRPMQWVVKSMLPFGILLLFLA